MEKTIILAGGCFWGMQAYYDKLKGVIETVVGYCNGNTAFPKYEDLKSGKATHAEALKITYDDEVTTLEKLLEHYLRFVDPYSVNKQGEDEGIQYRTGVYYDDMLDGVTAENYFASVLKPGWTIEIKKDCNFYPAETYHQHYLDKHPTGYCHINLNLIKPNEKK